LSFLLSEIQDGISERIADRTFKAEYRMIP
jgi:hypothetical protein